jgi:15-hydroxyprostaglandin dehydrogenase (NAD)
VRHLLSAPYGQKWRVVLADIRPEAYSAIASSLDKDNHIFVETDVGSWTAQAELFRKAYDFGDGKIDFLAANAGTAERDHIVLGNPAAPEDVDADPIQPPMLCTQVNQIGVFYGLKLFTHYARRTTKRLKEATNGSTTAAGDFDPKMVITSSCTALYPFPVAPEYCKLRYHPFISSLLSIRPPRRSLIH